MDDKLSRKEKKVLEITLWLCSFVLGVLPVVFTEFLAPISGGVSRGLGPRIIENYGFIYAVLTATIILTLESMIVRPPNKRVQTIFSILPLLLLIEGVGAVAIEVLNRMPREDVIKALEGANIKDVNATIILICVAISFSLSVMTSIDGRKEDV